MSNRKILHSTIFILILFKVLVALSIINKGVLPLERNTVAIQFFVDVENEDRADTCKILGEIKKCCLKDLDKEECDTMNVYGGNIDIIKPRDRKTLIYPFLSLSPHDLVGYCDLSLKYRCSRKRATLDVNIPFETKITSKNNQLTPYLSNTKSEICETLDENSLDDCRPVDCDLKYVGSRPFYDINVNRCIMAPVCIGDIEKDLPSVVYEPDINICKYMENPLNIQDIYKISLDLGTFTKDMKTEDIMEVAVRSNCSTISQNLCFLKDLMYGKLCPCSKNVIVDFGNGCKSAIITIILCIVSICAVLFSFVFCVNTTVWVHRQCANGNVNAFMLKIRNIFNGSKQTEDILHRESSMPGTSSDVRNALLRDVIVKDIPLELRDSVVSICKRMERKVEKKRRYRNKDIGSQISLQKVVTISDSSDGSGS